MNISLSEEEFIRRIVAEWLCVSGNEKQLRRAVNRGEEGYLKLRESEVSYKPN